MRRPRREVRVTALSAALAVASLLAACRPAAGPVDAVAVTWTLEPSTRTVGPATLTLAVRDAAGAPLAGARIRVEGHMTHAGMQPVLATALERQPGVYDAPLRFTMAGDWVLVVVATLPDGGRVERRIDVPDVRAAR